MNNAPKIKRFEKTATDFDKLLFWLDAERDRAAEKYLLIRKSLVRKFEIRSCLNSEELADETIERVTRKAGWLLRNFEGEQMKYFFAVARNVFLESTRKVKSVDLSENLASSIQDTNASEILDGFLVQCLKQIPKDEADFILEYYEGEKSEKIRKRHEMCLRMALSQQALRVRAFRIRERLKKSLKKELKAQEKTGTFQNFARNERSGIGLS